MEPTPYQLTSLLISKEISERFNNFRQDHSQLIIALLIVFAMWHMMQNSDNARFQQLAYLQSTVPRESMHKKVKELTFTGEWR